MRFAAAARGLFALVVVVAPSTPARQAAANEDGYDLWLRYRRVTDAARLAEYRAAVTQIVVSGTTQTVGAARDELTTGVEGLLGKTLAVAQTVSRDGAIVVGTPATSPLIARLSLAADLRRMGAEGFVIRAATTDGHKATVIAGNRDVGVLYGVFRFLREMQMNASLKSIAIADLPRVQMRMLDHWDNLDRSVERGYAGESLWDWTHLPDSLPARYRDYARTNASIGVNATALTNVNANAKVLTPEYLAKVKALAVVFRPYGIRVFLTARFSAPIEIGGLKTADPLDPAVRAWWKAKVDSSDHSRLWRAARQSELRGAAWASGLQAHACRRREHACRRARVARRRRDVAAFVTTTRFPSIASSRRTTSSNRSTALFATCWCR